jgi:hypothetical protein
VLLAAIATENETAAVSRGAKAAGYGSRQWLRKRG